LPFGNDLNNPLTASCSASTNVLQTNSDATEHHFTGKERDAESGNDYFGARYYASTMGRFMSPDPQYVQERMLKDPQSWNLYAYGGNNPLRFIDPDGEAIALTGDDDQRRKELAALQAVVGKQAGSYLYDNAVTDGNGNTQHYVGIYTNGPDGKSADFSTLNAASKDVSQIIGSSEVAILTVVHSWESLPGQAGGNALSLAERGAAGVTIGTRMYIQDPEDKYIPVPGDWMSNGLPGRRTVGTVTGHELGHGWAHMRGIGNPDLDNRESLDLENKVRRLKNPNAPTRTKHGDD